LHRLLKLDSPHILNLGGFTLYLPEGVTGDYRQRAGLAPQKNNMVKRRKDCAENRTPTISYPATSWTNNNNNNNTFRSVPKFQWKFIQKLPENPEGRISHERTKHR
jgi:hypothetical protein